MKERLQDKPVPLLLVNDPCLQTKPFVKVVRIGGQVIRERPLLRWVECSLALL